MIKGTSHLATGAGEFLGMHFTSFPWIYIPVWLAVTIPPIYTIFWYIGTLFILRRTIIHRKKMNIDGALELLPIFCFFGPIASILLSGAGIYTGWRHIYFIYPSFVILAMIGVRDAITWTQKKRGMMKKWGQRIIIGSVLLQFVWTGAWMMRNHPFEAVYYSILPTDIIEKYFLLDDWALSYKQSTEWLLNNATTQRATVYSDENQAYINMYNIFPIAQWRFIDSDREHAQYVLTRSKEVAKGLTLLHEFTVDGMRINGIYKGPAYTEPRH